VITEEDKKLLEQLGLSDIPEVEQQVVLEEIDRRMTKRFIANLLVSLDPQKAVELEEEVNKIPSENTEEIISKIIETHPDAVKVLQQSAQEIVDELKAKPAGQVGQTTLPEEKPAELPVADQAQTEAPQAPLPPTPPVAPEAVETAPLSDTLNQQTPEAPIAGDDQGPAILSEPISSPSVAPVIDENVPCQTPESATEPVVTADTAAQGSDAPPVQDEAKPLPVPQEEPAKPFGDEITMVRDEPEQTPPSAQPSAEIAQPSADIAPAPTNQAPADLPTSIPTPPPLPEQDFSQNSLDQTLSSDQPAMSTPETAAAIPQAPEPATAPTEPNPAMSTPPMTPSTPSTDGPAQAQTGQAEIGNYNPFDSSPSTDQSTDSSQNQPPSNPTPPAPPANPGGQI